VQQSFDPLTTPLHEVTFCVLDLETTGGSPQADSITEVGAVKVRGGEILGTFQTLVNPGSAIPPAITVLTGITEAMLTPAPPVEEVLPALAEFVGGAVLVGHNVRFDAAFLDAALAGGDRPTLGLRRVDTAGLARRLVRDEVPDCKLGTLALELDLPHLPNHRALDDARATVDLLHLLLERAASYGVSALDDLLALPALAAHPQADKLRLTARLPRSAGAYLFRDGQGHPLYAGRAANLWRRVRSWFAGDEGRVRGPVLRSAHAIEHVVCSSPLEAGVAEARLLRGLTPRHNRHGTNWRSYRYVVVEGGASPKLTVVRAPRHGGAVHLGPFASTRAARSVVEAIEVAVGLDGDPRPSGWADRVTRALAGEPSALLDGLDDRGAALNAAGRYAAAVQLRDHRAAVARALRRHRRLDDLRRAGHLSVDLADGCGAELLNGRLVRTWAPEGAPLPRRKQSTPQLAEVASYDGVAAPPADVPLPPELADEVNFIATWLDRHSHQVRLTPLDTQATPAGAPPVATPVPA
jgi:DNA polymerase-3 subunit epsilon